MVIAFLSFMVNPIVTFGNSSCRIFCLDVGYLLKTGQHGALHKENKRFILCIKQMTGRVVTMKKAISMRTKILLSCISCTLLAMVIQAVLFQQSSSRIILEQAQEISRSTLNNL
ncbi:MAG: hypothetical protein LBH57_04160, partial [Treponema sp.]|nr:hypothetical protein [Treponema sp.]